MAGAKRNVSVLGDQFGTGLVLGVDAGYQLAYFASRLSLELGSAALFGWTGANNPAEFAGQLKSVELSASVRLHLHTGDLTPRSFYIGGGGAILRTNIPVPPNDQRQHFGPFGVIGVRQFLGGYAVSLDARYGILFSDQPTGLTLVLGISLGA